MVCFTNQLTVIVSIAGHRKGGTDQILDFSICGVSPTSPTWTTVSTTLQMIEGAALFSLVIFYFVRESLQMHQDTKRWEINRYVNIFVKEGFLYFLAYVPVLSPPTISGATTKSCK